MGPSGFLGTSLGFSMLSIISSANSDCLTSSLPLGFLYFFLLWLPWLHFQTAPNKNGEGGHPSLVPDLEEVLSAFYQNVTAVSLSYVAFIMFRYGPCVSAGEFLSLIDVEFYQKLFLLILRWTYVSRVDCGLSPSADARGCRPVCWCAGLCSLPAGCLAWCVPALELQAVEWRQVLVPEGGRPKSVS